MMPPIYAYVAPDTRVRVTSSQGASVFKNAREPDLSRDGRKVAYWADAGELDGVLQVRDVATGKEQTLRRANLRSPRFSPDGKTICFTEYRGNKWTLCSIAATGGPLRIIKKGVDTFMPVWQDDGSLYAQVNGKFVAMDWRGEIVREYPVPVTSSGDTAVEGPDGTLYYTNDVPSDDARLGGSVGLVTVVFRWTPTEGSSRVSPPKTDMQSIRVWNAGLIGSGATVKKNGVFWLSFDGKGLEYQRAGTEPGI